MTLFDSLTLAIMKYFFYGKSGLHFDRLFTAGVFKFIGNFSKNTKNQGHKTSVNTLTDTDTDTMRHKQVLQCD